MQRLCHVQSTFSELKNIFIAAADALAEIAFVTDDALREAENFFHERIPLTRAMGVKVVSLDQSGFAIEAPVALNFNHLHTAFGGSVNAVATLAGYGFLWLQLREQAAHVVVAESSIRFLRGIRETIRGVCAPPTEPEFAAFKKSLREKGKARITLAVVVEEHGAVAAEFHGTFVAFSDSSAATAPRSPAP